MFRALFPCLMISSFAQDISSLVEQSKQAALSYQEEAKSVVQHSQNAAKAYQNEVLPMAEKAAQIQQEAIQEYAKMTRPKQGKSCQQFNGNALKTESPKAPLKIFVSSSMPKESLKALHMQAQRIGARLIFRGLIQNSFKETQRYFKDLGISADIDPPAFEEHRITHVPTFVLVGEKSKTDRLQGNISLDEALAIMTEKGDLKWLAKKLKGQLHEARP